MVDNRLGGVCDAGEENTTKVKIKVDRSKECETKTVKPTRQIHETHKIQTYRRRQVMW